MAYRLWSVVEPRPLPDQDEPIDPRVARSRAKIFAAVLELLAEDGYDRLTIEGVAARAGVGKTTIYRHWDTRARLVADAVDSRKEPVTLPDTGTLRGDLLEFLGRLADRFSEGHPSRILPALISAAEVDPELEDLHRGFVHERRRPLIEVLEGAVARGELSSQVDLDMAVDLLSGPIFYRRFISREPVTRALVEQLVDTLLPQLDTIRRAPGGQPGRRHGNMRATS